MAIEAAAMVEVPIFRISTEGWTLWTSTAGGGSFHSCVHGGTAGRSRAAPAHGRDSTHLRVRWAAKVHAGGALVEAGAVHWG